VRKLRGERRRRAWWPAFHPDITLSIAIYRQADRSPLYLSHGKVVFTVRPIVGPKLDTCVHLLG
jgi:hypothetical protein